MIKSVKNRRYCNIKGCIHFYGSNDSTLRFFQVKKHPEWEKVLKERQSEYTSGSVCMQHFAESDIEFRGKSRGYVVKDGAVPTIFDEKTFNNNSSPRSNSPVENISVDIGTIENPSPLSVVDKLQLEIKELRRQIVQNETDNHLKIQKLTVENDKLKSQAKGQREKIKTLEKTLTRERTDAEKLSEILRKLESEDYLSQAESEVLRKCDQRTVIQYLLNGNPGNKKIPESVRQFCLSLHFHSPRGYEYVREVFSKHLPAISTIRKWYANSDAHSEPGLTTFSLDFLKKRAEYMKAIGKKLIVSLSFDEMCIRKNIQWFQPQASSGKFLGFTTYGSSNDDIVSVASKALVFMINGINCDIQLPVAYHFVASLKHQELGSLLTDIIKAISECDVKISNVTFDGLPLNGKTCSFLGANIDNLNRMDTFFNNPSDNSPIYILFDPSHMIKLVRNVLGSEKVLRDDKGQLIQWKYFVLLEKYRREKIFNFCHKLTRRHIDWDKNKMNVSLATQALSNSVADAMEHLMKDSNEEFADAAPTIRFIRLFNDLFDVMNSRFKGSFDVNILKRPLYTENKRIIFDLFQRAAKYIASLQVCHSSKWIDLVKSELKTGFKGFLVDIETIKAMYTEYVENENLLDRLPVFTMSQDHLECFFGKVRSLNRQNDNPTEQQFIAAYRKLLCISDIKTSNVANCQDVCYRAVVSNILNVASSKRTPTERNENSNFHEELDIANDRLHVYIEQIDKNDHLVESCNRASIVYAATKIEERLNAIDFYCENCQKVFSDNEKVDDRLMISKKMHTPCKSTFDICKICDLIIESKKSQLFQEALNFNVMYYLILKEIGEINLFPKSDFSEHRDHKYYIIRCIVDSYIRIKLSNLAQSMTLKIKGDILRNYLRKLVHYSGQ